MKDQIERLLEDFEPNHTDFQIDNFIIGKQGDNWAQYKQALREIDGRYKSLVTQKEELELLTLNRVRRFFRWFRIRAQRRRRKCEAMMKNIAETERELRRFLAIAMKLKARLGKLDYDRRKELEADSWLQKTRKMAGVDMLVNGGQLSKATLEMIIALPRRERRTILAELTNQPDPNRLLKL